MNGSVFVCTPRISGDCGARFRGAYACQQPNKPNENSMQYQATLTVASTMRRVVRVVAASSPSSSMAQLQNQISRSRVLADHQGAKYEQTIAYARGTEWHWLWPLALVPVPLGRRHPQPSCDTHTRFGTITWLLRRMFRDHRRGKNGRARSARVLHPSAHSGSKRLSHTSPRYAPISLIRHRRC